MLLSMWWKFHSIQFVITRWCITQFFFHVNFSSKRKFEYFPFANGISIESSNSYFAWKVNSLNLILIWWTLLFALNLFISMNTLAIPQNLLFSLYEVVKRFTKNVCHWTLTLCVNVPIQSVILFLLSSQHMICQNQLI